MTCLYDRINRFNQPADGLLVQLANPENTVALDKLRQLDIPVLVVSGASDPIFPTAALSDPVDRIPTARIISLPTGHLPFFERPEDFSSLVQAFFDENGFWLSHAKIVPTVADVDSKQDIGRVTMRKFVLTILGLVLAVSLVTRASADANLRMIIAFDERFPGWQLWAEAFRDNVKAASGGGIKVTLNGPAAVSPFQQFAPVSQGAFDLSINIPPYYMGTTAVSNTFYAMDPDMDKLRRTGVWDFIDNDFGKHNQKLIAGFFSAPGCFHIMLKSPLKAGQKPFDGMKIRANRTYTPVIEPLGGSIVTLPAGEIYSALEKGVVDGAAWTVAGTTDLKLHEVAGHMLRPTFGWCGAVMTMNLDAYKKLGARDREILVAEARKLEKTGIVAYNKLTEEEDKELRGLGIKEARLSDDVFAKVMQNYRKNMWEVSASFKGSRKAVNDLRALARSKGLAD